uniref:Uncharacterized protein n=1 Tax=Sphaerodactylus townsendi TaxID=933632 RepID=A0ACB8GDC8_9SAUR
MEFQNLSWMEFQNLSCCPRKPTEETEPALFLWHKSGIVVIPVAFTCGKAPSLPPATLAYRFKLRQFWMVQATTCLAVCCNTYAGGMGKHPGTHKIQQPIPSLPPPHNALGCP